MEITYTEKLDAFGNPVENPIVSKKVKITGMELVKNPFVNGIVLMSVQIELDYGGRFWVNATDLYEGTKGEMIDLNHGFAKVLRDKKKEVRS
jgi:hypothetical protein